MARIRRIWSRIDAARAAAVSAREWFFPIACDCMGGTIVTGHGRGQTDREAIHGFGPNRAGVAGADKIVGDECLTWGRGFDRFRPLRIFQR